MFVRTRLESLLGLCLLVCTFGHASAQSSNPKTLGDMIEQAKRQQAQAFSRAWAGSTAPQQHKPPVLWSLNGINEQLVAEVIYAGKVHILRLNEGDRTIGPWMIERYGANGLHLVPASHSSKTAHTALFLPVPMARTSLQTFDAALPSPTLAESSYRQGVNNLPMGLA
ncbi:MAG: hypothetical protein EBR42_07705, partial [Betaproteobacteria bacterium]|nr:hypothetical protein [Betaproteobacteria bacterium]